MSIETLTSARPRLPEALHDGPVTLLVRDRATLLPWYRTVLGFVEQASGPTRSVLGAPGGVPLVILQDAGAARGHDPRTAGLFHVAYLMPSREDLARWVAHLAAKQIPIDGASDHLVSEAFYLHDPEGNGIEVYRDRPRAEWRRDGEGVAMDTLPADIQGLLTLGQTLKDRFDTAPAGTTVGHVHLKVADLAATKAFYIDALGFDLMATYPGALFVAAGGYHHHLGLNVWQSRGRPRVAGTETGLIETTLVLPGGTGIDTAAGRLSNAGFDVVASGADAIATDPAGLKLHLIAGVAAAEALAG